MEQQHPNSSLLPLHLSSAQQEREIPTKNDPEFSPSSARQVAVSGVHVTEEATSGRGGAGAAAKVTLEGGEEGCGRERLKRHRVEVAGRVWIPEIWGQEELLKDWIDCSGFDAMEVSGGLMSARAALVEEGRRANSGKLRIENRC